MRLPITLSAIPAALPVALRQRSPLFSSKVVAGFPSPADDYIETRLDLNEYLVMRREATFFIRVKGDSMRDANIHDGSLLIVDKSLEPKHNNIVVAVINGELTVKRLYKRRGVIKLLAANEAYPEIAVDPDGDMMVWGVVKHVVHTFG